MKKWILISLALAWLVTACGQYGALRLPEQTSAEKAR